MRFQRKLSSRMVCNSSKLTRVAMLIAGAVLALACNSSSKESPRKQPRAADVQRSPLVAEETPTAFKPPPNFIHYSDARVGFEVWAPRQPSAKITPLTTPEGKTLVEEFDFGVQGASHTLLVTVTQLPVEKGAPLDAEGAITNARDGMRRKLSGVLLTDGKWKPKVPDGKKLVAREFRIGGKVGQLAVVAYLRLVVRDTFLYQVMAMRTKGAAPSTKVGNAFVRSFQLGPRPKPRPLLPPGVLPVTIGKPTIELKKKFRTELFFLRVKLDATVVQPLVPLEQVVFKVWCKVGGIQKTFERASQGLRAVAAKTTKQLHVAPFLANPLAAEPTACQIDISVRKAATDVAKLASFCFAQTKVSKGGCPQ